MALHVNSQPFSTSESYQEQTYAFRPPSTLPTWSWSASRLPVALSPRICSSTAAFEASCERVPSAIVMIQSGSLFDEVVFCSRKDGFNIGSSRLISQRDSLALPMSCILLSKKARRIMKQQNYVTDPVCACRACYESQLQVDRRLRMRSPGQPSACYNMGLVQDVPTSWIKPDHMASQKSTFVALEGLSSY